MLGDRMPTDRKEVTRKLRLLAEQYEQEDCCPLCFDTLGEIFGNEFWNLLYCDHVEGTKGIAEAIDRLRETIWDIRP